MARARKHCGLGDAVFGKAAGKGVFLVGKPGIRVSGDGDNEVSPAFPKWVADRGVAAQNLASIGNPH